MLKLWLAVAILATANSVVRKLTEIGELSLIDSRNPISFCNVLFAGNLIAFVCMFLLHRRSWTRAAVQRITPGEWGALLGVTLLSVAAAPALIFTALDLTSVTSVVLLGRIEPPLVIGLGVAVLGERLNLWGAAGAIVALVGVAASLLLQPVMDNVSAGAMLGRGEILALAGAVCFACGTILSKAKLGNVPLGIFATVRVAVGTIVFAAIVMILFGAQHFTDIFSPVLWRWMLLYGTLIVALGQTLWFAGLRTCDTSQISLASSFTPLVAIAAAFVILGEVPMAAQITGGAIILAGVAIGQFGASRGKKKALRAAELATTEMGMGFRGV